MFKRLALVRQHDQSDCGAAALATIALHHGLHVGLQAMRELGGTDRVGTNLQGLLTASERLGFLAKAVKASWDSLADIPLPAIAHIVSDDGLGHFVVVHRVQKNRVVIADPAKGILCQSRDEFCRCWTGYLLLVVPDQAGILRQKGPQPIAPWRRFVGLLAGEKALLVEAFTCAVLMTLLSISTSYFIQHLIDNVLVRGETRLLNAIGVGMVLIVVFRTLFAVVRRYLLAHIGRKIDLTLISAYTRHILRLPTKFFEMRQVGEILSRVNDVSKIQAAISGTTLTVLVDGVMVLISVTVLWMYDAQLAAAATVFIPLLVGSVVVHQPAIRHRSREAMENAATFSAHLVESISGVDTVKSFTLERSRSDAAEARLVNTVRSGFSLQMLDLGMSSAGMLVTGVASIVVLWYGGHRVIGGGLTIGELMFFSSLLSYMLDPLERLAGVNLQIQDALVAMNRVSEITDLEVERVGDPHQAQLQQIQHGVRMEGVSFSYGCRGNVLENVSLQIPVGAKVAIVGESGSGKSTLLKLLSRCYDPTAGRITLDGTDYRDFDLASLRAKLGMVSQEPFVFTGTIRDNIALDAPHATMDAIVAATRAAGLDEFVNALPDRYQTIIGERGANLSGGQRQRLAIARALLRKPEILIFDEATSHLDTATERAIHNSLQGALAGKTVVLVAHRLSTIKDADVIYVLSQGRIVEQGNHRELLSQDGAYAALCRAQAHDLSPLADSERGSFARVDLPREHGRNGHARSAGR